MRRVTSEAAGFYKRTLQGIDAFVPNSLPPNLTMTKKLTHRVEEATYLLGQVEMCRTLLPNANLLIYSPLQNEALASSTIEGTIASPQELVLFQVSQRYERQAAKEVANYATALEWGCSELPERPITTRLILGLHQRLLCDVRGASAVGRFKAYQNAIGSHQDDPIEKAVFVPSPPESVNGLMSDLERYFNLENAEQKVIQCALAHYQFETIHPFADGNGRVGRLLIILHMIQLGLLSAPLIYPSVYFERNRQSHYQCLQGVRDRNDWESWIRLFCGRYCPTMPGNDTIHTDDPEV